MNGDEVEYGRDRLVDAVRQCRNLSTREMIDHIHRDLIAWTDGRGAHDDVTVLIVKAL
jgi:serine phosphatase RsbU (regulator of sigma subunit)